MRRRVALETEPLKDGNRLTKYDDGSYRLDLSHKNGEFAIEQQLINATSTAVVLRKIG